MTPHRLQAWTGESNTADALLSMLQRLPHAEWVVTTLGSRGSAFMQRAEMPADTKPQKVQQLMTASGQRQSPGEGLDPLLMRQLAPPRWHPNQVPINARPSAMLALHAVDLPEQWVIMSMAIECIP